MKIGMIGAGVVALAIARRAIAAGHEVVLCNSTGGERLASAVEDLGDHARAGTLDEVVEADLIVLAVPWLSVKDALPPLPDWKGRIVVDTTNPFVAFEAELVLADLEGEGASELIAALMPGARVVKAFNSIYMTRFEEGPAVGSARRVLFVSGDDADAKGIVSALIESIGFVPIDLGTLATGGRLEQAGGPLAGPDILVPA